MDIYRDYTTLDVICDKPCMVNECGYIYPIKVKDYILFDKKYNIYFTFSPAYLRNLVPDEITKLSMQKTFILVKDIKEKQYAEDGIKKTTDDILDEIFKEILDIFSIITRKDIIYQDGKFCDKDREVVINDKNFDFVKKVVALSNMIYQPTYYKNKEYARIIEKAKKAHNKGGINLDEMIAYVKNSSKLSYEEILNQNIFQLKCDYHCLLTSEWYRTAMNFRCVSSDKSLAKTKLTPNFIEEMFNTSDNHLFKTLGEIGF